MVWKYKTIYVAEKHGISDILQGTKGSFEQLHKEFDARQKEREATRSKEESKNNG